MSNTIKVGDKLYGTPAHGKEVREHVVSKVGRKYFECEQPFHRNKYHLDNLKRHDPDYPQSAYQLYRSLQEIEDQKLHTKLCDEFRNTFGHYSKVRFTLDQLLRIKSIIDEISD